MCFLTILIFLPTFAIQSLPVALLPQLASSRKCVAIGPAHSHTVPLPTRSSVFLSIAALGNVCFLSFPLRPHVALTTPYNFPGLRGIQDHEINWYFNCQPCPSLAVMDL